MSQADGSSATVKSSEKIDLQIAVVAGGRREAILVLAMVLAPVPLAIILVATSVLAMAGWQIVRGVPVEIPTSANLQLYGLLAYVAVNWIDVVAVWLWSARRALRRDVFVFHGPTWAALTASIVWFVIAMYGAPFMTHWLSHLVAEARKSESIFMIRNRSQSTFCSS